MTEKEEPKQRIEKLGRYNYYGVSRQELNALADIRCAFNDILKALGSRKEK